MTKTLSCPSAYTVEEANQTLAFVSRIAHDILIEQDLREQTRAAAASKRPTATAAELLEFDEAEDEQTERIDRYLTELADLGISFPEVTEPYVHFPTTMRLHHATLCWQVDDPTIDHWHAPNARCQDRKPL